MKKLINHIQNNASDEEKLSYALFASGIFAVLSFVIWFTTLQVSLTDILTISYDKIPAQENSIQKASAFDFADKIEKNKKPQKEISEPEKNTSIKPQEINI